MQNPSRVLARCPRILLTLALAAAPPVVSAEIPEDRAQTVALQLVELLREHYVFPERVDAVRAALEGGWSDDLAPEDSAALGEALTRLLYEVTSDRHLRVRPRRPRVEASAAERLERARRENYGFGRLEVLDGNLGYLEMRSFAPAVIGRATAEAALRFLGKTDALIVDLRRSEGGDPSMVQLLCSAFLGPGVHLNSFRWRAGERVQEIRTLEDGVAPRRTDVPLFVLTGSRTFSAAEELAYDLQALGRARIVGQPTRGGANPGREFPLGEALSVFVPTGTAVNPVTGTNWEGTGVKPDLMVTEEAALDRARIEAAAAAEAFRAASMGSGASSSAER